MDNETRELEERYEKMRRAKPHDVFGVWQGCGKDVVKERYYELVKEFHPDNYASSSARAREIAQELFLLVRNAHTRLLKLEREQTRPQPGDARQEAMERLKRRSPRGMDGLEALSQASEAYESISLEETPAFSQPIEKNSPRQPSLSESSLSADERKQRLSALASKRTRRPPIRRPMNTPRASLGEETSLSAADRRAKLEALASKRPKAPFDLSQASAVSSPQESSVTSSPSLATTSTPSVLPTSGMRPEAIADTNSMDKLTPREAFRRGYQDFKLGRFLDAKNALEFAYKQEPENGLFMTFYAYTIFKVDAATHRDEAEQILRKAIATGDRQALPDAHLFLGTVLTARGNKQAQALKHFRAALHLNPESHEAQRQIRLHEMRQSKKGDEEDATVDGFFKKLFKK